MRAAEEALKRSHEVGPLEVLQGMGLLSPVHVEGWRKGQEWYPHLEKWIQGSAEKLEKSYSYFQEWVRERGLRPIQTEYLRAGVRGAQPLKITEDGDPAMEAFYRTHYVPADLPARKVKAVEKKLQKAPELVVYQITGDESKCSECGAELGRGQCICLEQSQPICMQCADMDHLIFVASGDATLSRRARVASPLSAVVVRFNKSRKRYERQGIVVTPQALDTAEAACLADEHKRSVRRERAAILRVAHDADFVADLTKSILAGYPHCPPDEARSIAEHTGMRGSGRVGRSAAGRGFEQKAIDLAVAASVRHNHTNYDALLMSGVERSTARQQIRAKIEAVLDTWR